ncbi:uncharacterized protein I206_105639 [Kwoniella pini CBS 10737]|uniref:Uncharacterized protein n=1 Tax=Kwoniella pini CBS 10737 TaxID=1296096 RepID=A0A1B9I3P4_9TREE|nr:uncharacterized protein I206_03461 [Kwoniella pini CBS 10737]OCF50142.1 hypothetical protein I206_03461 [Kwoniella pini CBS 10737]
MFPTSSRSRTVNAAKAYQHESPPTPTTKGEDSYYGVKSVSSWGEQSEVDLEIPKSPEPDIENANSQVDKDNQDQRFEDEDELEMNTTTEDRYSDKTSSLGLGLGITSTQDDVFLPNIERHTTTQAISPSRPIHTKLEQRIVPPSPEDTVHPLDRHFDEPTSSSPTQSISTTGITPLTLEHITRSFDSPYLPTTSEPSSPASFTSMPSYVASLSSLSRTSSISPMGINEYNPHHHAGSGSIEDDLVLPTLALPSESLSLHMSLSKWQQYDNHLAGSSIALLGPREDVERCLRRLRDSEHLVEIKSGVGVVRDGKIVLRIITTLKSVEHVRSKILYTYNTLNALLHPQMRVDTSAQAELRRLVEGYVGRSDWIHGAIALGDTPNAKDLDNIVPVQQFPLLSSSMEESNLCSPTNAKTPCIRYQEIEPTPKLSEETSGYFAPRTYTPSPSSSREASPIRSVSHPAVQHLLDIVNAPAALTDESINAFLLWRSSQVASHREDQQYLSRQSICDETRQGILAGERTMTSSITSASSGVGAMPTVARAQGGGEWEATLSRRVAQRRESDSNRDRNSTSLRGSSSTNGMKNVGRIRRKKSSEKLNKLNNSTDKSHSSLFPTYPSKGISEKGLGIDKLMNKTFVKSVRRWTQGWRGLLVVGLVVAVGCGWWISKKV